jgi:hypothetical protein
VVNPDPDQGRTSAARDGGDGVNMKGRQHTQLLVHGGRRIVTARPIGSTYGMDQ